MSPLEPVGAPSADLMQGAPPEAGRLVTLDNWLEPPFNRWSYLHVRELVPTAPISRGDGPVWVLEREDRDVWDVQFALRGEVRTVAQMLDETYTDAFAVVHDGRLVAERYWGAAKPDTLHLLQSVSKSLTATLAGVLVGQGRLDPSAAVCDYLSELRGGAFDGCTVQHLLDMRAGTRFSEEYENPEADCRVFEQVCGWRPWSMPGPRMSMYEFMAALENDQAHGGLFRYRSILTNVLGWVLERASGLRFAELFSRELWSCLGAQSDANITVDAHGCAVQDGGFSVTLLDLARFGQMHLDGGVVGGRQLVPAEWIERLRRPLPELAEAFAGSLAIDGATTPNAMYHDKWWVLDPDRGIRAGIGIHGQLVLVHEPSRTVVVKLSTTPRPDDDAVLEAELKGALALCASLCADLH